MCNLSQGVAERAMEKGVEQGIAQGEDRAMLAAIRNLMETLDMTSEKAMDVLKVPEAERAEYLKQLKY